MQLWEAYQVLVLELDYQELVDIVTVLVHQDKLELLRKKWKLSTDLFHLDSLNTELPKLTLHATRMKKWLPTIFSKLALKMKKLPSKNQLLHQVNNQLNSNNSNSQANNNQEVGNSNHPVIIMTKRTMMMTAV
jgi:hypothetical protein